MHFSILSNNHEKLNKNYAKLSDEGPADTKKLQIDIAPQHPVGLVVGAHKQLHTSGDTERQPAKNDDAI